MLLHVLTIPNTCGLRADSKAEVLKAVHKCQGNTNLGQVGSLFG